MQAPATRSMLVWRTHNIDIIIYGHGDEQMFSGHVFRAIGHVDDVVRDGNSGRVRLRVQESETNEMKKNGCVKLADHGTSEIKKNGSFKLANHGRSLALDGMSVTHEHIGEASKHDKRSQVVPF